MLEAPPTTDELFRSSSITDHGPVNVETDDQPFSRVQFLSIETSGAKFIPDGNLFVTAIIVPEF